MTPHSHSFPPLFPVPSLSVPGVPLRPCSPAPETCASVLLPAASHPGLGVWLALFGLLDLALFGGSAAPLSLPPPLSSPSPSLPSRPSRFPPRSRAHTRAHTRVASRRGPCSSRGGCGGAKSPSRLPSPQLLSPCFFCPPASSATPRPPTPASSASPPLVASPRGSPPSRGRLRSVQGRGDRSLALFLGSPLRRGCWLCPARGSSGTARSVLGWWAWMRSESAGAAAADWRTARRASWVCAAEVGRRREAWGGVERRGEASGRSGSVVWCSLGEVGRGVGASLRPQARYPGARHGRVCVVGCVGEVWAGCGRRLRLSSGSAGREGRRREVGWVARRQCPGCPTSAGGRRAAGAAARACGDGCGGVCAAPAGCVPFEKRVRVASPDRGASARALVRLGSVTVEERSSTCERVRSAATGVGCVSGRVEVGGARARPPR